MLVGWGWPGPVQDDFTREERIFHATCAPLSAIGSAYVFAQIIAMTSASSDADRHLSDLGDYSAHITTSKGPKEFKKRILQYRTFLSVHNVLDGSAGGGGGSDGGGALSGMSANLEKEWRLYEFEAIITSAPFFQAVEATDVVMLVMAFKYDAFAPGDFIIRKGDIGRELYFVMKGSCLVLSDTLVELAVKYMGEYFGEVALLSDTERTAHVQSQVYSLVATLDRDALLACVGQGTESKQRTFTSIHQAITAGATAGATKIYDSPDEQEDATDDRTPLISSRIPMEGQFLRQEDLNSAPPEPLDQTQCTRCTIA